MNDIATWINDMVWSLPFILLCLGAGLYFTIRTRLVQLRQIPEMLRLAFNGKKSEAGISSFQSLALTLAGRVGTGNIAGVATAIAMGGPGAVFWMWMVAFLGASTSFIECTLGQIFKEKDHRGQYRGGPAYYIEKCMKQKWYAFLFAGVTVLACGVLLPGVQSNSISAAVGNAWNVPTAATAIAIVIALAFVVVGGVKWIAGFASLAVPFMAVAYIALSLIVVVVNFAEIPNVIGMIFSAAFTAEAGFGAAVGSAVMWGVKRGLYSNEAGQGTAPHAASAAEVDHPAQQGLVQAFSVYIDTLFVCSATAFLILSTGAYNVFNENTDELLHSGGAVTAGEEAGPVYAQSAFDTLIPGAGSSFVAISLMFFAFTTLVAYYYIAETNINYLLRSFSARTVEISLRVLQLVFLVFSAYGVFSTAGAAWTLGDVGVGVMAWLNIVAILIIQRPALAALRDYEAQKRAGLPPHFDPVALGIKNATFWEERAAATKASKMLATDS
jgi:AGCS family alanine or glycine:cation symporter